MQGQSNLWLLAIASLTDATPLVLRGREALTAALRSSLSSSSGGREQTSTSQLLLSDRLRSCEPMAELDGRNKSGGAGGRRRKLVHGSFKVESVPFPQPVPLASFDTVIRGAVVVFSPIFWGGPGGYGYWDRLFGMFATSFLDAGFTDVHNMTGCIAGQAPCATAAACAQARACLNSTFGRVKTLFYERRQQDASYGLVLVTMVYTPLLVLPKETPIPAGSSPARCSPSSATPASVSCSTSTCSRASRMRT